MKSQKINNYQLTGSIHTLQIKSTDIPDIPANLHQSMRTKKFEQYFLKLNIEYKLEDD